MGIVPYYHFHDFDIFSNNIKIIILLLIKKNMTSISWPGNQINDILKFRNDCFEECHKQNPTDSGWYEKTDECGKKCFSNLKNYQIQQGKNPCAQKLQAPVFWFKEDFSMPLTESSQSKLNMLYIILLVYLLLLVFVFIVRHIIHR